jgi:hypothetical protein
MLSPSTRRRRGCGRRTGWVHIAKADAGARLHALLKGLEFAVPVAVLAAAFDQTPWRVAVRRAARRHLETQSRRQRGSRNRHRHSALGHKCRVPMDLIGLGYAILPVRSRELPLAYVYC